MEGIRSEGAGSVLGVVWEVIIPALMMFDSSELFYVAFSRRWINRGTAVKRGSVAVTAQHACGSRY